jgi:hypothetical protein
MSLFLCVTASGLGLALGWLIAEWFSEGED